MIKNCLVILNYNDSETTIKFINLIKEFKILDLIVIVDNCSTDNSYKILKEIESNNIIILKSPQNKGYNAGNNIGCHYIIEKYQQANIIISNPDIIVKEETIKTMINIANQNANIAVIAPTIIQDNSIERGWKIPTVYIDSLLNLPFAYRLTKRKIRQNNIRFYDEQHYQGDISYVDTVTGCFFLIKSDTIKIINYFDENIFLYGEEDILGKVIKGQNKKIVVANQLSVIHDHSRSINKSLNSLNKVKISNQSKYYFHKNYNHANKLALFILSLSGYIKILNTKIKVRGKDENIINNSSI